MKIETNTNPNQLEKQAYQLLKKQLNYREDPVDILTFLKDPYFLGNFFTTGKEFLIYDKWIDVLLEIFPNNVNSHKYNLFSGGIGLGKTTIIQICQLYTLYKFLCIDDFRVVSRQAMIKPITFTFTTHKLESAISFIRDVNMMLENSPFFIEKSNFYGKKNWKKLFQFIPASLVKHIISNDCISIVLSEINEITQSDRDGKSKAWTMMREANNRLKSRYMRLDGLLPQLLIDSSSKSADDLTSQFANSAPFKDELKVFKFAKWEMKKNEFFKPRRGDKRTKFFVFLGNSETQAQVLDYESLDNENIPLSIDKDLCRVAPIEYINEFKDDLEESIRAIMGLPITIGESFFNPDVLKNIFDKESSIKEVIFIDEDDRTYLLQNDDAIIHSLDKIPDNTTIYIGLDIGVKKDLTGISIAYIKSWREKELKDIKVNDIIYEPLIDVPLVIGLDRLIKGQSTSITRIFNFFVYLSNRFNIGMIYTDTFGSVQLIQELNFKQIPCDIFSVESEAPYTLFKNLCKNDQLHITNNSLLKAELISLIRDPKKVGNLNHPLSGNAEKDGNGKYIKAVSKDLADATCRAIIAAYTYSRDTVTGVPSSNFMDTTSTLNNVYKQLNNDYYSRQIINSYLNSYTNY